VLPPLPQFVDNINTVEIDEVGMAFYDLNVLYAAYGVWDLSGFGTRPDGEAYSYVTFTGGGRFSASQPKWVPGIFDRQGKMIIPVEINGGAQIIIHSHSYRIPNNPPDYGPSVTVDPPSDFHTATKMNKWIVTVSHYGIFGIGPKGQRRTFRGPGWVDYFR